MAAEAIDEITIIEIMNKIHIFMNSLIILLFILIHPIILNDFLFKYIWVTYENCAITFLRHR